MAFLLSFLSFQDLRLSQAGRPVPGLPGLQAGKRRGRMPDGKVQRDNLSRQLMINHIQKDLLRKHIGPFLFCFFTVMFILLMQFLILHVDKLVGKGLPLLIVLELIINNLAYMVVLAGPMAVLVATLMAFGRFSEWNELTAIRAAGINPFRLMVPVLVVALLLTAGLTWFSNEVLPESNHRARSLFIDIRMQKPGFDLQPGIFYTGIEGYTFLVREIPVQSDSLYDVTIIREPGQGRERSVIKASRGWLETPDEYTLSLFLEDGTILNWPQGNEESVERSRFGRYRMSLDLSDLAFSRSNPQQRSRNDRTMSARAMQAVIDTLNMEKESEFRNHLRTAGAFNRTSSGTSHTGMASSRIDTVQIYRSRFEVINDITDVDYQLRIVTQAMADLNNYSSELENLRRNIEWRDSRIAEYQVEIHKKFSIPFSCIIFVLIGGPIGMMTRRGNIGFAAIVSAVILTAYFVAVIQGEKLADRLVISPFMGMWGINMLMGLIGILLTLRVCTSFRFGFRNRSSLTNTEA